MSTSYAAHAQACLEGDDGGSDLADDDGGAAVCEEPDSGTPVDDADASVPDAGSDMDAGHSAGNDAGADASVDIGHACSCESAEGSDQGLIHVCTGSESADVCSHFSCDTGTVRNRPCPVTAVKLCCDMRVRDQYSQLYEDCTHPNCETGFRAQCDDFGGFLTEGPCDIETHDEYAANDADDSGGGFCSVSRLGTSRAHQHRPASAWLALVGVALGLCWRRRRRASLGLR